MSNAHNLRPKTPKWVGTCVELRPRDLEAFDDSSRGIKYRTFARHVGQDVVKELNARFGYPAFKSHLKQDCHVSFARGRWRGRKAVCMFHSCIHHIWLI